MSVKAVWGNHNFILQGYNFKLLKKKKDLLYLYQFERMCGWRPEEGVKWPPMLFSAYHFERRLLPESVAHLFS